MIISVLAQLFLLPQLLAILPAPMLAPHERLLLQTQISAAVPQPKDSELLDIKISAKSAIAVDEASGAILFQKNTGRLQPIASITKLMSALVVLDNKLELDRYVTMGGNDRKAGGMQHFNIGEKIKLRDLISATLIASDNEAAFMMARSNTTSLDSFVEAMNRKAKELKMNDTVFADPTGLDADNISTAGDLVKLVEAASRNELIATLTQQKKASFNVVGLDDKLRGVDVYTTDQLATSSYLDLLTGKTGYLQESGYCLATKLKSQNGRTVYVVVLGSDSLQNRFQDVKAIEYFITHKYQ